MRIGMKSICWCIVPLSFFIAGCDKTSDSQAALVEAQSAKASNVELQAEVSQMKARLLVLEGIQEKRLKEMDTRLSAIEVGQKKAPSRTIENQSVPDVAIPSLRNAIAQCVQQVRTSPEAKAETAASSGKFWTDFDAYYNSVSREVKNNVVYQGSRPALYMFNKCLGANGFAIQ